MRDLTELYRILTLQEDYQKDSRAISQYEVGIDSPRFWYKAPISEFLFEKSFRPHYPQGKAFAVCITHDIDLLYNHNSLKGNLYWGILQGLTGDIQQARYHFSSITDKKANPEWRLSHTLDLLRKFNINSSFYFLALEPGERDFNYKVEQLAEEWEALKSAGHEIGLHGGHEAFNNLEKMSREKAKLESSSGATIRGYRSHYLNLSFPKTWEVLEELDMAYDHSLGFSREIGFRNGLCYPSRLYSAENHTWRDLFILPLTIMDVAVFLREDYSFEKSLEICKQVIKEVADYQGVCSILWHNNYMQGEMGEFFTEILGYLQAQNAWMTSTEKLLDWWQLQGLDKQLEQLLQHEIILPYEENYKKNNSQN